MRRRAVLLGLLLLLAFGVWFFWPGGHRDESATVLSGRDPADRSAAAPSTNSGAVNVISTASNPTEPRIALADGLNAPDSDIHRDLMILQDIFIAWRTNYPHDGNPVGENEEITAVLTGRNSLQLALIPKNHPAINARGELCDRWGTPFVFHQLSGTQMEIRSAGPDRKLYTPDDVVLTP
jgi:hypothetical protein